jgi:NAD(P)-dependent dehydrogenase (short-subunit alcohol dehydrogenase family)
MAFQIDLKDKTAIVTGGTRGIGRSISEKLLNGGCRLIYTGVSEEPADPIVNGEYYPLDLEKEKSIQKISYSYGCKY